MPESHASVMPASPFWAGWRLGAASAVGGVARAASASSAGDTVEVCGVGSVTQQELDAWTPATEGPVPHWQQALDRRKDAALHALAARLAVGSDSEQVAARVLMNDPEGAALIASRTREPAAYRLALARCESVQGAQASPHCRALSAKGWAQIDPEDGRPWLRIAADGVLSRDNTAAEFALEQALQRRKLSSLNPLLPLLLQARAGVSDDAGLGLAMVHAIGVDAALPDRVPLVGRYCSAEAVKDVSRRNRCERLARWQFEHADNALDALLAIGVADRVGMPADQRPFTREQVRRGMERLHEQTLPLFQNDCDSLRRIDDWVARRATEGELQMAFKAGAQR